MKTSVIIPTYNAEKYLPALLENLKNQTMTFELIIIDSSSTDGTLGIARRYTENIITIPAHEFDHGGTRTQAAKVASGDILVFLTQDALPCNNRVIEEIVCTFSNKDIAASYGRQIPYENSTLFGKHLRQFNYPKLSYTRTIKDINTHGIKTAFLSDSFSAYRKSVLSDIGWFKNGLIVGEDSYVGAKLILNGYALHYHAKAQVFHSHSYTSLEEFKRYFDIGVFHKEEHWILEHFGKAEGEGKRYIQSEFKYIVTSKAYHRIPEFFLRNGLKYIGYKLGQNHRFLSIYFTKKMSMHTLWWDK